MSSSLSTLERCLNTFTTGILLAVSFHLILGKKASICTLLGDGPSYGANTRAC